MIIFNLLNNATTGGTWAYVGTTSPAPPAPATYNGNVDFSGYAEGDYTYEYTVNCSPINNEEDTSQITVTVGTQIPHTYPDCSSAYNAFIPTNDGSLYEIENLTTGGTCPGMELAGCSGVANAANWPSTFVCGDDVWIRLSINVDTAPQTGTLSVGVNSSNYTSPITQPHIAIYTACATTDIASAGPLSNTHTLVSSQITISSGNSDIYIRVASLGPNSGDFTLQYSLNIIQYGLFN